MIDEKCEAVLKKILDCSSGDYTVMDSSDFLFVDDCAEVLSELEDGGYIATGYSDDTEYLLKPTALGKRYFKNKDDSLLTQSVFLHKTAVNALIGGLLGATIANFAFWLVFSFLIKAGCGGA